MMTGFRLSILFLFMVCLPHTVFGGEPDPSKTAIWILRRDWHTEIAIPKARVPEPLFSLAHWPAGADFLIIGFGAKAYMPNPNAGIGDAADALTGGPGAMELLSMTGTPKGGGVETEVVELAAAEKEIAAISDFTWVTIRKRGDGTPEDISEPTAGVRYLETSISYGALHNCNSWTAAALAAAGYAIDPDVLFASDLMRKLERIGARE